MPTTVNQIYTLVNTIANQALGTSAIAVVDTSTLVSLGNTVLSSQNNTEMFLNTLVQRIGKTIFSYRKYDNYYDDFVLDDFEWGAIVQKIKVSMPEATEEEALPLTDGESVDMYKISKPKVSQKLFTKETPYKFFITIQREYLKEAFLNENAMDSFIGYIYGEVENRINLALENLVMATINNYVAEVSTTSSRVYNLVTLYNDETGDTLTSETALHSKEFIAFAIKTIKKVSKFMSRMSKAFNDATETRHTPYDLQRILVATDFIQSAETVLQYQAFNEEFVKLNGYKEIPYWQAEQTPLNINVKRASDAQNITVNNLICVLADRDALGIYKKDPWTASTPFNASGGYINTYWHMKELYFNDLSENFVYFTLN